MSAFMQEHGMLVLMDVYVVRRNCSNDANADQPERTLLSQVIYDILRLFEFGDASSHVHVGAVWNY